MEGGREKRERLREGGGGRGGREGKRETEKEGGKEEKRLRDVHVQTHHFFV